MRAKNKYGNPDLSLNHDDCGCDIPGATTPAQQGHDTEELAFLCASGNEQCLSPQECAADPQNCIPDVPHMP